MKRYHTHAAPLLVAAAIAIASAACGDAPRLAVFGVKSQDLRTGIGDTPADDGLFVIVRVTVHNTAGQQLYDSRRTIKDPSGVLHGPRTIVNPGVDAGIQGMRSGGKRELLVPPHLHEGYIGVNQLLPPDRPLIFTAEVLRVSDPPTPKRADADPDQS